MDTINDSFGKSIGESNVNVDFETVALNENDSEIQESNDLMGSAMNSQEEESVQYFRHRLIEVDKSLESLMERMQEDVETLFGQIASQIVESIQNYVTPISTNIEEIRYKCMQRNEIASNLGNAENAIQSFYHCLEGKPLDSSSSKD